MMEHFKNSIEHVMQLMNGTATMFYQQNTKEGLEKLTSTISSLLQTTDGIIKYQSTKTDKILDEPVLNAVLSEAMKAIESKDYILLADIMIYEIGSLLEESLKRI